MGAIGATKTVEICCCWVFLEYVDKDDGHDDPEHEVNQEKDVRG